MEIRNCEFLSYFYFLKDKNNNFEMKTKRQVLIKKNSNLNAIVGEKVVFFLNTMEDISTKPLEPVFDVTPLGDDEGRAIVNFLAWIVSYRAEHDSVKPTGVESTSDTICDSKKEIVPSVKDIIFCGMSGKELSESDYKDLLENKLFQETRKNIDTCLCSLRNFCHVTSSEIRMTFILMNRLWKSTSSDGIFLLTCSNLPMTLVTSVSLIRKIYSCDSDGWLQVIAKVLKFPIKYLIDSEKYVLKQIGWNTFIKESEFVESMEMMKIICKKFY
jgi:hypothetical protein